MAVARDLAGKTHNVVCVIGDGAMSAGMAYEAMNNAGAMDSRLIVILNDNDMSIAPPVGAMSAYLARLISGRDLPAAPQLGEAARQDPAQGLGAQGGARRGIHPRLLDRRHAVRGDGLLLCRADRRTQFRSSASRLAQRARHAERPDPDPCRDPEGQRLRARGEFRRQVPWGGPLQRRHRSAGAVERRRAELHQSVRQCADRGGEGRRQDRGDHRGDAVRHRARPLRAKPSPSAVTTSASPSSMP